MLNMTIDQILPGTAKRLPGKIALIFGERTVTYSELERLTNQAANGLKALGVAKAIGSRCSRQTAWSGS